VILKEDGGPAVGGRADEVLSAGDRTFELGESPVSWCCLELVGALADINDVLQFTC